MAPVITREGTCSKCGRVVPGWEARDFGGCAKCDAPRGPRNFRLVPQTPAEAAALKKARTEGRSYFFSPVTPTAAGPTVYVWNPATDRECTCTPTGGSCPAAQRSAKCKHFAAAVLHLQGAL